MAQDVAARIEMRDVTEDEVEFYKANGWVKLEGLIPRELAASMLDRVKPMFLEAESRQASEGINDRPAWRDWHFMARDDKVEPFRSLSMSPQLGKNAQRMIGRDAPVQWHADLMAVKMPSGHLASQPTGWHQDWVNFPFDRVGFLSFWFALEDMPAERGVMRFLNGSHQEGPLGKMGFGNGDPTEYYPHLLERYEISKPFPLDAGDVTIHNGMVVHGAPENTTDKPRWAYISSYHPGDTCYTGAPHYIFSPEIGLEVGKPIKHDDLFPVIYP